MLLSMFMLVSCQQNPTNGTLGMFYSLNSTKSVNYNLPNLLGSLTCSIEGDSILYGDFSLSEATNVKPGYTWTSPDYRKQLTPLSIFFSLNLTRVFIPDNFTEDEYDFESSFLVNWKSYIPTTFNLNPNSFQLLELYEKSNHFSRFSNYSPKEFGTTITIEQAFKTVVTFGVFVYNTEEKVSFNDYVSINYPRSIYIEEYSGSSISKLSYNFPMASYQPNTMSDQTIKVAKGYTPDKNAIPSGYALLGLYFNRNYDTAGSNLTLTQSSITISITQEPLYWDYQLKNVDIDINTITCVFVARTSLPAVIKTFVNNQLTCFLDNSYSQDHDLYVVAKLKVKPKPSPTPPRPKPSNNDNNGGIATEDMLSGFTETITLKEGQEILYNIFDSKKSIVEFKTKFISGGITAKPIFYIGYGYKPNKYVYDGKVDGGNGVVSNKYSQNVYMLISNTDKYALDCKFTITPNVTKMESYDNSIVIRPDLIVAIVLPIVGVILCVFILVVVMAVIVRQRSLANARRNDMNGHQMMNTTPYYEINNQY